MPDSSSPEQKLPPGPTLTTRRRFLLHAGALATAAAVVAVKANMRSLEPKHPETSTGEGSPEKKEPTISSYLRSLLTYFPPEHHNLFLQRVRDEHLTFSVKLALEKLVGVNRVENTRIWEPLVKKVVGEAKVENPELWQKVMMGVIGVESKGEPKATFPDQEAIERYKRESGSSDPRIKNKAEIALANVAKGLCQVKEFVKERVLKRLGSQNKLKKKPEDYELFYSEDNIFIAFHELYYLYRLFGNNLGLALAAYNEGEATVGNRMYRYLKATPQAIPKGADPNIEKKFDRGGLDNPTRATEEYGPHLSVYTLYPESNFSYVDKVIAFSALVYPEDFQEVF